MTETLHRMERHYWLSCMKLTIYVGVSSPDEIVLRTAPIARRFIGQPLANLEAWMSRLGGFEMAQLGGPPAETRIP